MSRERVSVRRVPATPKLDCAFNGDAVLRAAIDRGPPSAADRCEALGAIAGAMDYLNRKLSRER
jgi:hypothetical protein